MGNEYVYVNQPYYPPGSIHPIQPNQNERQISIRLNKYDYFKGDTVEGAVIINCITSLVLNDIYLNLYLHESWSNQDYDPPTKELNSPILLTVKIGIGKILKIDSYLINLNPGSYNFPFKFKLPDFLQPCFEYPKVSKRGALRYILEAKIISQYLQGDGKVYIFVKSRPKILNCPLSFSSAANVHKWGMIDQGSTILKVSYQNSNYQIRGQIPITVEINNTRGKLQVKSVNVKAVRRVQYRKVQEAMVKFHLEDIMVNKVFDVSVPPNTNSQVYTYTIDLNGEKLNNFNYAGTINPYPKLVDLAFAMPTTDGAAVKCDYFLVVTLSFTSFVTKGYIPKVIVPFTLTHQNLNDYNLEQKEDEDLKKAIAASLLDVKDKKTVNDVNINEVNINEIDNKQIKNEEVLDDQKGDNNHLIDDNLDFSNINQIYDNNEISSNDNQKQINSIKNEIKDINNNINQILNDNDKENNINQINNGNINIIENNNNKSEVINSINNNININNANNENNNQINNDFNLINSENKIISNENNNQINNDFNLINNENKILSNENNNNQINENNNNQNNIKLYDNDDDINPYLLDSNNNEQKNDKNKNFSINDID